MIDNELEAVITSYNQKQMITEAFDSICRQTILPKKVFIADDGTDDPESKFVLHEIEKGAYPVDTEIIYQSNKGVSAARNTGIAHTRASYVLILDGDDRLENTYIEKVSGILKRDDSVIAASSYMHTFGVMNAVIHPDGGSLCDFLSHNCCPAAHIMRRNAWETCGGYDEAMQKGFEDWDFFLSILETKPDARIEIYPEELIAYRTVAASSNIKSMEMRTQLMKYIIEKHSCSYHKYLTETITALEKISIYRLTGWEREMKNHRSALTEDSKEFLHSPTYGDGGMAAAIRVICSDQV